MRIRNILGKGFALIASAYLMWGCGNANDSAPAVNVDGNHPAGWYVTHRTAFPANPGQCPECHGAELQGGIAKVSCFSATFNGQACHLAAGAFHPPLWTNFTTTVALQPHGAAAKQAPSQVTVAGFSSCQTCHGRGFSGGVLSRNTSCFPCHGVSAPHPAAPWRASAGSLYTHGSTNLANAPVCAQCHLNGANSVRKPLPPLPPAGTAPECFNNTLCHRDPFVF